MFMDEDGMNLATEIFQELKRSAKRWFIAFLVMIAVEIATIWAFMWYISLPIEENAITVENDDGNANYIGNDMNGDLYNE